MRCWRTTVVQIQDTWPLGISRSRSESRARRAAVWDSSRYVIVGFRILSSSGGGQFVPPLIMAIIFGLKYAPINNMCAECRDQNVFDVGRRDLLNGAAKEDVRRRGTAVSSVTDGHRRPQLVHLLSHSYPRSLLRFVSLLMSELILSLSCRLLSL